MNNLKIASETFDFKNLSVNRITDFEQQMKLVSLNVNSNSSQETQDRSLNQELSNDIEITNDIVSAFLIDKTLKQIKEFQESIKEIYDEE
ncbi:hypothetical protein [Vibrio cholerae]|uniref:hypothetical protein n=1 Tax=Vibrio cholerae TaxID=666 RepID=UPI000E6CBB7C|nr:hypothetical protein [Vibrio cholerae]NOF32182.1 hypothetical protein [Vibrio cholerae]RJK82840.1 hypothetical protein CHN45_17160 [Vibrio cholerae]